MGRGQHFLARWWTSDPSHFEHGKKYEKMIGHVFSFDWEIPFGGCDVSLFWFVNLLNFQDSMIANRPCDEHLNREGVAHTFLASCNIAKKPGRVNPKHWPQATVNQ